MQISARAPPAQFGSAPFRRRLRRRDTGAWSELYQAYGPRLEVVARRVLPPRLDPEAAAQESWVRALSKARRLSRIEDPYPWLCTICINLCISVLRRDAIRRRGRDRQRAAARARAEDAARDESGRTARLRARVAALPRTLQQVVYLRFGSGLSVADSAEVLGTSAGAVRQRLSRAYSALRDGMGSDENQEGA